MGLTFLASFAFFFGGHDPALFLLGLFLSYETCETGRWVEYDCPPPPVFQMTG